MTYLEVVGHSARVTYRALLLLPCYVPTSDSSKSAIPSELSQAGGAAIAVIASRVAQAPAVADVLPDVLEILRLAVDGAACELWMLTPAGLVATAVVGSAGFDQVAVEEARPGTASSPGVEIARLVSAGRRVGALAIRGNGSLDDEARQLVRTVADVLAPALAHAERAHRLEAEVATRTRQIDQQRSFIGKIVDSLPVGLYVIDREYRIQAWNRKRETGMQGISREEALGRTIFEILHRQPAELLRREFDDVFSTGRIQQFQMESSSTGEPRTYRISKIPMRVDDGAVSHVITIGEDVSEWRAAEERIAEADKLAAVGQLAAGVMHEINNPLATIGACAEGLALRLGEAADLSPEWAEYLKLIDTEVHRCKRIVDGLLDFSRPKPVTKELVNLNDVLAQTLFLLKHHARVKRVRINTGFAPELRQLVWGDPEQLVQVFMALMINAVDAMGELGTVTVRTRGGTDDTVSAEVSDEGQGIPRALVKKIFEPFYTTKAPGRGTGLGLSIAYTIVTAHGGRIDVESAPGQGSTFRVVLPVAGTAT